MSDNKDGSRNKAIAWTEEDKLRLVVRLFYAQPQPFTWEGVAIETGHSQEAAIGMLKRLKKQYITDAPTNDGALAKPNGAAPKSPVKKQNAKTKGADAEPATPKKLNHDEEVDGEISEAPETPKTPAEKLAERQAKVAAKEEAKRVREEAKAQKDEDKRVKDELKAQKEEEKAAKAVEKAAKAKEREGKAKEKEAKAKEKEAKAKEREEKAKEKEEKKAKKGTTEAKSKSATPDPDMTSETANKGVKRGKSKTPAAETAPAAKKRKPTIEEEIEA